ncbi:MAG: AEC family transporter [Deltaproteobacteria bacterium]|nr:AEC family transporter [Deltaproteobacteria bacterium]
MRISPVFLVLALGIIGKRLGFIPDSFVGPANRLIYYFAIPFLVFLKVSYAPFREAFNLNCAMFVAASYLIILALALVLSRFFSPSSKNNNPLRASFVQASTHGNLGYIGIAVIYYAFGDEGLTASGFALAVLILMQNVFSILVLIHYGGREHAGKHGLWVPLKSVLLNPIIISLLLGLLFSIEGWTVPDFLHRSMDMISGMALPMALLIIGASLSFATFSRTAFEMGTCAFLKLLALPALGVLLFSLGDVPSVTRSAATVLLAAPTATVSVVMSGELGGDPSWAANTVSFTTLLSVGTYYAWMWILNL